MSAVEYCFRYVDQIYAAPLNEYDEPCGEGRREVRVEVFKVLRRTPKGFWVDLGAGEKKIVNLEANKQFAHLTKGAALESYKARKRRQIHILSRQLQNAETFLSIAAAGTVEEPRRWQFDILPDTL